MHLFFVKMSSSVSCRIYISELFHLQPEHCSAENFLMLMTNQLVDQLYCKTTNVYTSKYALHINRKL